MKNLNAGGLRHRVTVLRNGNPSTPNASGQARANYAPVGSYYALVQCLGGGEVTSGNQQKGLLNWSITLRASSGPIYPSDQITWNSTTMNLSEATPDPMGIFIEVKATSKGQQ